MKYPSDDEIRQKADDIQTEAAWCLLNEPGQTSGPPASYGRPAQGSGDTGFDMYKGQFQGVTDTFERFLTPDPSLFASLYGDLNSKSGLAGEFKITDSGKGLMKEKFPGIDRLETAIIKSDGETFENFGIHFLDKFDTIWFNHASVCVALAATAATVATAYARARADLIEIGDMTIKLLKEAQEHDPLDGLKGELEVISEVSGWLSLFTTPIKPVSATLDGIAIATQALSYTTDDEKNDGKESDGSYTITGTDAVSIVSSMYGATTALENDVETALKKVKANLSGYNDALEVPKTRKYFITPDVHFPDKADV